MVAPSYHAQYVLSGTMLYLLWPSYHGYLTRLYSLSQYVLLSGTMPFEPANYQAACQQPLQFPGTAWSSVSAEVSCLPPLSSPASAASPASPASPADPDHSHNRPANPKTSTLKPDDA